MSRRRTGTSGLVLPCTIRHIVWRLWWRERGHADVVSYYWPGSRHFGRFVWIPKEGDDA